MDLLNVVCVRKVKFSISIFYNQAAKTFLCIQLYIYKILGQCILTCRGVLFNVVNLRV